MDIKNFEIAFANREACADGYTKPSAVLVPLIEINGTLNFLITQRAFNMKHQPGDFCFPGGRSEGIETPVETALRETFEELGIPRENVTVLGPCDFIISSFGAHIKPFLGTINNFDIKNIKINQDEVEKVLFIPIDFFLKAEPMAKIIRFEPVFPSDFPFDLILGGKNYKWGEVTNNQTFYDYEGNIIWGLTAKIIDNIKSILKKHNVDN